MRSLAVALFLYGSTAMACWKLSGEMSGKNDTLRVNQKVEHDQSYSFMVEDLLVDLTMPTTLKSPLRFRIRRKSAQSLIDLPSAQVHVKENEWALVEKKGELKIQLKLTHI